MSGLFTIRDIMHFLSRWDVIAIATFLVVAVFAAKHRLQPSSSTTFKVNYSTMDRLLHWIAFSSPAVQLTAADIEEKFLSADYREARAGKPIFITSLPRAGTTLMLEALCRFPSLATHTYRDMPFVMSPVLWSRVSGPFRKNAELTERAHQDGMQVGYDSPEAFEEIIWHTFWPEKYTETSIELWGLEDEKDEALTFFTEHMKKIVTLRRPDRNGDGRYISKNNGNIGRIDLIGRMFPEGTVLVPVRHPIDHAASLLRQHLNFIEVHKMEPFALRYMRDIGHYEFGELHRPIAFPGINELVCDRKSQTMDYWVAYWIAAFEYVIARRKEVTIMSYESTCRNGGTAMASLCERLEIPQDGMLDTVASIFRTPSSHRGNDVKVDKKLLSRAEDLHHALISQ